MPMTQTQSDRWLKENNKLLRLIAHKLTLLTQTPIVSVGADFTVGSGGGAPANGADTYANPALDGKSLLVYKVGTGYLASSDFSSITGGGIELTNPATFSTAERYIIFIVG